MHLVANPVREILFEASAERPAPMASAGNRHFISYFVLLWIVVFLCVRCATPGMAQDQQPPPQKPARNQQPSGKQNANAEQDNQAGKDNSKDNKPKGAQPLPAVSKDAYFDFQGEATFILQSLPKFHSPYEGPNSFRSRNETELSDTYTLYLGARVVRNLEVYINPEIAWGNGLSAGQGLAGYTNGDLIGQPNLRPEPYFARYFVRWRIPMHGQGEHTRKEQVGRAPNFIESDIPPYRMVATLGKMAISDIFDTNTYANNPRTQFINNAFVNNLAYDFAQETRGYNVGAAVTYVTPNIAVRFGTFAMPTVAGGPDLAYNLGGSHSEQLEFEFHPALLQRWKKPPLIVRLLGYRNVATMGSYQNALNAAAPDTAPDLNTVRKPNAVKYGFGLNFEQPLADGGATGIFGRLGWNNGVTESYNFAESDGFQSLGAQISGAHWRRKNDVVGIGVYQSEISSAHRAYLAAGGQGINLGDGALNYGAERGLELYYAYQLDKRWTFSFDYQYLSNPGYNQDRGPVSVLSLRAHFGF